MSEGQFSHREPQPQNGEVTTPTLVVLFMDVNGFKEVNDTLGHPEADAIMDDWMGLFSEVIADFGDPEQASEPVKLLDKADWHTQVESLVAQAGHGPTLASHSHTSLPDLPNEIGNDRIDVTGGRVGGDEFAFACHTDEAGAYRLINQLRDKFETYNNAKGKEALRDLEPGLAIGIAFWREGMSASDLLRQADHDMYRDKLDQLRELSPEERLVFEGISRQLAAMKVRPRDVPKYLRLYSQQHNRS